MVRWTVAAGIAALGIAVGAFSLGVAQDDPAYSFAGGSTAAALAFLAAGWALIGCGLVSWIRRPDSRFGALLAAAGFGWFLLEWTNPGIGSALAFTIGLALSASCPPLAAHAVLGYPGGRLRGVAARGAVVTAYVGGLIFLGIGPALVFDPQAQACSACPRNLLVVADRGDVADDLTRIGLYVGLASMIALSALAGLEAARASNSLRPVYAAGAAYFLLVAGLLAASLDDGFLSNGTLERRLWLGQAVALAGASVAVGWDWWRARRARSAVARLVLDLAQSPPVGGLQAALAGIVGDPDLVLAYPLDGSDRLVDARGRQVELSSSRERTTLVREGRPVAVLAHRPGLLADEQLVDEVAAAARLALENERLQAEVRARLAELRASRARIVESGDAERKRLERDLHDGAQQRLVGLSLSLRLLRSQLGADANTAVLDQAESELRRALAELRDLAHGIFPAVLADEGLATAVEALAEEVRVPLRIRALTEGRYPGPVETTAYTVVAEAARAATTGSAVRVKQAGGAVVVEVETDSDGLDLVALEDRVGAIDGRFRAEPGEGGRITISAELPCGS